MNAMVQCANTKTIFKPLTENDFDKIDGTYRQATINIPYRILVDVFGEPLCGDSGIPTEQIQDWSIGGHCSSVVNLVESALVETMDSSNRRLLEEL